MSYLLRHRKGFAVAFALFAVAAFLFAVAPVADSPTLTALGWISTAGSVFEFSRHVREVRSYNVGPAEVDYKGFLAPPLMDLVALERSSSESDYAFAAQSELLQTSGLLATTSPTVARWDEREYQLPKEMRSIAAGVLFSVYRKSKAPHFNGRVVRQMTDLDGDREVRLCPAAYFDVLCTNYLASRTVSNREGDCVVDGRPWFGKETPSGGLALTSLTRSRLVNVVGASSLAFTADVPAQLILVRQSDVSASSPGLWAPSASGSMDDQDVEFASAGATYSLPTLLTRTMERELVEESNLESDDVEATRVLGYYRWLNKGGKPEYVGVTRLRLTANELRMRPRVEERPWVKRLALVGDLDTEALRRGDVLRALPRSLRGMSASEHVHVRDATSFPLYMCLHYLGLALRQDSGLEEWLRP